MGQHPAELAEMRRAVMPMHAPASPAGSTVVLQVCHVSSKEDSSHWFPRGALDLPHFCKEWPGDGTTPWPGHSRTDLNLRARMVAPYSPHARFSLFFFYKWLVVIISPICGNFF